MAQSVDEGQDAQFPSIQFDLKKHLSKFNIAETTYEALSDESTTVDELITFTVDDLTDWCKEHSLTTIERRRFVNAVKALPNCQANVDILLDNKEKDHLSQFDEMKNGVLKTIDMINKFEIEEKNNMDNISKEIDDAYDEFISFADKLRNHLLQE